MEINDFSTSKENKEFIFIRTAQKIHLWSPSRHSLWKHYYLIIQEH
uniref:Uncharacterized protein n=1 Tax=Rhizophora mucronata TaxID=61149 RepID=A0A2P2NP19_RHIMU